MKHFTSPHKLCFTSALRSSWLSYYFCNILKKWLDLCIHDILTFQLHVCHADATPKLNYLWNYCWTCGLLQSLPVLFGFSMPRNLLQCPLFTWGRVAQPLGCSAALPVSSGTWLQAGSLCPQSRLRSQTRLVPSGANSCQKHVHCRSNEKLITSGIYLVLP